MSEDFEEVAMGGNAFDMAVGIITVAAFGYSVCRDCRAAILLAVLSASSLSWQPLLC
jgi:large-conductance mechanosensitive channel